MPCGWAFILALSMRFGMPAKFLLGRGLYRLAKSPALTNPDWVTVGLRIPRAVICLISALAHHELTTQVPHYVDIALPSHAQIPKVNGVAVRVFWFPVALSRRALKLSRWTASRSTFIHPSKQLRTVLVRNKIGIDVAIEALRAYRERVGKLAVNKLVEYARICRVERVMRPYVEAVL